MTFEKVFEHIVKAYEGDEFLIFYENGTRKVMTKDEYVAKTNAIAAALEPYFVDIPKHSWVSIKVGNDPYWFSTFFALLEIGYKVILLDNNYQKESILAFKEQSDMKAIVADKADAYEGIKVIPYNEIKNANGSEPKDTCWESKIAFCTSGTTGNAKMYVFYADTVEYQSMNIGGYFRNNEEIVATRGDRKVSESYTLLTQPFRHCLGFGLPLAFWRGGFPCVMAKEPGIFGIANACKDDKIWLFISVPAVWKSLLLMANKRYGDMSSESLRKLLGNTLTASASAGAILDEVSAARLKAIDIDIMNGWGMTETGFVTIGSISNDDSLDYVGDYYNKHHAMIMDKDGNLTESGYGELYINGKAMYDALLIKGEEHKRDENEYFATGDIFELHGNSFYFKGRCKNVITNDNGENIYPEELDAHFAELSDHVSQFCTAEYDNKPCLYISTKGYTNFDEHVIFDKLIDRNNKLPMGQRVSRVITTPLTFPLTGKAEISRISVKQFVTDNKEQTKEFSLVKKGH